MICNKTGPLLCSPRKNPYPPQGLGHWKFLEGGGGGGVILKAKILEAKHGAKLEFPGGEGGGAKQKPSVGGVWIFSGTAHF